MPEFVGAKPASVTLEMFFDASEGGDVAGGVDKLLACLEPHPKTKKDKPSPPFVSLGWGVKTYLDQAVVKSVSVKYTRFRPDGTPIRAVASVTLEELRPVEPKQNPTSGAFDVEVERIMRPGDTLASIAYDELGSPALWRVIAEANGIDDPFRVPPGRSLIVPGLAGLSGASASATGQARGGPGGHANGASQWTVGRNGPQPPSGS
jgi:nucleoid-associated protein YgaU